MTPGAGNDPAPTAPRQNGQAWKSRLTLRWPPIHALSLFRGGMSGMKARKSNRQPITVILFVFTHLSAKTQYSLADSGASSEKKR